MDRACDWVHRSMLNLRAPLCGEVKINWGAFPVPNPCLGGAKAGVSVRTPLAARGYTHGPPVPPPWLCPRSEHYKWTELHTLALFVWRFIWFCPSSSSLARPLPLAFTRPVSI